MTRSLSCPSDGGGASLHRGGSAAWSRRLVRAGKVIMSPSYACCPSALRSEAPTRSFDARPHRLVQDVSFPAGCASFARALPCSRAMADATTFVVDYEDRGLENVRGELAHTRFVMFSLLHRQESLSQFEAPYVNLKTGRMGTTTFFRGEPVLYHPEHKSGCSSVYIWNLPPLRFPPAVLPSAIHTAKDAPQFQF